jgi:hypothetical protein
VIKNGCYQCPDRKPGCHSVCEKYKEWKAEHDAKQAAIRAKRDMEYEINAASVSGKIKALKRRENWKVKER